MLMSKVEIKHLSDDSIIFIDSKGDELKCYWFAWHEVIIHSRCKHLVFTKQENPSFYKYITKMASEVKRLDNKWGGGFFQDGKFTWHHLVTTNRSNWERQAGFVVSKNDDGIEFDFFPSADMPHLDQAFFITMGGPMGCGEPYQPISDFMSVQLNGLLKQIPITQDDRGRERQ